MYILAFETSCDDTSVALMKDDKLVAMSTRTQLEHEITGGVVPEVAARSHANAIFPCIDDVLAESKIPLSEIDFIACTKEPGLAPSLLTGKTVARSLANLLEIPLIWVHHIEAHMFANFLDRKREEVIFPNVVLTISGGHTEIYLWKSLFEFEMIGQTRDDAVGEAYDKVAKMLGMGFPGGAKVEQKALEYRKNHKNISDEITQIFPRPYLDKTGLEFSFSGLKSAVKRFIDENPIKNNDDICKVCYAFQEAIFDVLLHKFFLAQEKCHTSQIILAGGVSASATLRNRIQEKAQNLGIDFLAPKKNIYSMDNAAMIGILAYYKVLEGEKLEVKN
ncbi:tRNA (adenosine(37)-N6)-threonylcarbamoyltransferase complex transferase subunit TsaD [Candidatus Gracilibacteria bacterium]|nr:tRNA (adenosine(37)-N6)-threonylcarbamoyltransferase complex transferase subunit TsaD [Candidatus Gracilibacteria bacterium]